MFLPKVTTVVLLAIAVFFESSNADLVSRDDSALLSKVHNLMIDQNVLGPKRVLKKGTWSGKKDKGKRKGKGKGGGKKKTWAGKSGKGKGKGKGKGGGNSVPWSRKGSKGKGKGKGKGGGKKQNDFLDQIQYPYDAWLPQEDSEDASQRLVLPSLSQPFYDNVIDVRATVSAKDVQLILSIAGNWQFALTKLLGQKYFPENPSVQESYLITTSPPISIPQMQTGLVKVGNILYNHAQPHVAAGPGPLMDALSNLGFLQEEPIPILRNYGNVILKLKGDDTVNCFGDLANIEPGRFASSGPAEGSTTVYRNSIRGIAINYPELIGATPLTAEAEANKLVYRLFDQNGVATIGPPMHHSIPHVLATGQADAGLMFLELAVLVMTNNPGIFEAIYLAKDRMGMTDDPAVLAMGQDPLDGNVILTMFVSRTTTPVSVEQSAAREALVADLQSAEFTTILGEAGLRPPL